MDGRIRINGAKNSAVALLAAVALTEGSVLLENLPQISDVECMADILQAIGFHLSVEGPGNYRFTAQDDPKSTTPDELAKRMRASYYFMGSLLGRLGESCVALPGGCDIGARPVDQHLKAFRAIGAEVVEDMEGGRISLKAQELKGATIFFDMNTVGATINAMLAACRAQGVTVLENAAREPEVIEVANFLNAMGARVRGAGTETIRIYGVKHLGGCTSTCIPDRIEAGTFMMAAAATKGVLTLVNVIPEHLDAVSAKLGEAGIRVTHGLDWLKVDAQETRPRGIMVKTLPYPGYPTDLQPQAMAFLCKAAGNSRIQETIYERRFGASEGLVAMGAKIRIDGNNAFIEGVESLTGCDVYATDLRCGASLLIAGLSADGETHLHNLHHIDRGYDRLVERLTELGMDLIRVTM